MGQSTSTYQESELLPLIHCVGEDALKCNSLLQRSVADGIKYGAVVEKLTRVKCNVSDDQRELQEAVDDLFGTGFFWSLKERSKTMLCSQQILFDNSPGECKQQDFHILWWCSSLMRVDFYCWRYNFTSSKAVIPGVENLFSYAVIKRIVNPVRTFDILGTKECLNCLTNSIEELRQFAQIKRKLYNQRCSICGQGLSNKSSKTVQFEESFEKKIRRTGPVQ